MNTNGGDQNYIFFISSELGAYIFKSIARDFYNNIGTTINIEITAKSITFYQVSDDENIHINVILKKQNFTTFKFNGKDDEIWNIQINSDIFWQQTKELKKKDNINLYMLEDDEYNFWIDIYGDDESRNLSNSIPIIKNIGKIYDWKIREIDISNPTVVLKKKTFAKGFADVAALGIDVIFEAQIDAIKLKTKKMTGSASRSMKTDKWNKDKEINFQKKFSSNIIKSLSKFSDCSTKIRIYATEQNKPLWIKAKTDLGTKNIYLANNIENNTKKKKE